MIHGTTEIFAICISGAAGIRIGMAIAFPGTASRVDAAVEAGRTAATAMGGTVLMLAVAGPARRASVARPSSRRRPADVDRARRARRLASLFLRLARQEGRAWPAKAIKPRTLKRSFITPEGVDLRLELGSAGSRAAAFIVDFLLMIAILGVLTFVLVYFGLASLAPGPETTSFRSSESSGWSASSSCATAGSRCLRWEAAERRRVSG